MTDRAFVLFAWVVAGIGLSNTLADGWSTRHALVSAAASFSIMMVVKAVRA